MKQFKHLLTAVLSFFICLTVVFPQTISGEENDIKTGEYPLNKRLSIGPRNKYAKLAEKWTKKKIKSLKWRK